MLPAGRVTTSPLRRDRPELAPPDGRTAARPLALIGPQRGNRAASGTVTGLRTALPAGVCGGSARPAPNRRLARLVVVVAALVSLIVLADGRVAAQQARGQSALDQATRSRLRATAHLTPVDAAALSADLLSGEQQARIARSTSGSPAWTVLSRLLPGSHLEATRAGIDDLAAIAAVSPQLRRDLESLAAPGSPPISQLQGLATSLEAYAVAVRQSRRTGHSAPEADAADRAATAAALLPGLAGQDHARDWLICPARSSSCTRFRLEPGRDDGIPVAADIHPTTVGDDHGSPLIVRGFDASRVLSPAGSTAARWRPLALLNLLIGLNLSDGVSVHSPDPAEQSVIDRLARG